MSTRKATRRPATLPPGVEAVERRDRAGRAYVVYRLRYRDAGGARRSRSFDTVEDAEAFRSKVRLAERSGELAELDAGTETLDAFRVRYFTDWAIGNLSARTIDKYARAYDNHLGPRIGTISLRAISPAVVDDLAEELRRDGVGPEARRAALVTLQSIFRRAVVWGRVRLNPVAPVRKPGGRRARAIRPLAPATVEAIRRTMLAADDARSATLVSVLAYAGLRPEEALALEWRHVRDRTLLIEAKNVDGEIVAGQKTARRPPRTVDLLAPLKADLLEWRLASGRPADRAFVFARADGASWRDHDWQNWRRRVYDPAKRAVGVEGPPYDLRHSFASLRIHEGRLTIVELAAQMGHAPSMCLETYAHVMSELRDAPRIDAAEAILAARAGGASGKRSSASG